VDIRRATEADAEAMRRLWDEFCAEATFTPYPGAPFEPTLLTDHVALLAEEGGEAVGTVYANLSSPHFGFVFGLYTRPSARRRGIARALMRAVAAVLREQGRRYVVLSVDTPNEPARAFYERLGFVDAARTLRANVDDLRD
jgi:ribosomal protein S18 acetylase RimI-like enzyme